MYPWKADSQHLRWINPDLKVPERPMYAGPCACSVCNGHYIPFSRQDDQHINSTYTGKITNSQAGAVAFKLTRNIDQHRSFLVDICSKYGNVIQEMWMNTTSTELESLLRAGCPGMYEYRMGEARENSKAHLNRLDIGLEMRKFRTLALLPYINLEVLAEDPARLPSLLHNRIQYSPEAWAPYDCSKLKPCWETGAFGIIFNSNCVIMHGTQYGNLTEWNPEKAHCWEVVGYPRAQLLLDAQEQLMGFLKNIVGHILKGNLTPASPEGWTKISQLRFKQDNSCEFASSYLNQPFSAPPLFDIKQLLSIAQTRTNAAEDHLWLLQTDSSYMRHTLKLSSEAELSKMEHKEFPHTFVSREIIHEAHVVWSWRWLLEEVENLERIYDVTRARRGEPLPPDINHALGALETLITYLMRRVVENLFITWATHPEFSHTCKIGNLPGAPNKIEISDDGVWCYQRFRDDPLAWCLKGLLCEPDESRAYDHAMLYGFLDHLLATGSSAEKGRLDEALYGKFSNLAALHEMRDMILLHRPRSTKLNLEDFKRTESGILWEMMRIDFLTSSLDRLRRLGPQVIFCQLLSQFEATQEPDPTAKRDKRWLKSSDLVPTSLDAFWDAVKEQYEIVFRDLGLSQEVTSNLLPDLSAHKAPEHLADLKAQRNAILAIIEEERALKFAKTKKSKKGKGGKKSKAAPKKRPIANHSANSQSHPPAPLEATNLNNDIADLSLQVSDEVSDSDDDGADQSMFEGMAQEKSVKVRVINVVMKPDSPSTTKPLETPKVETPNMPLTTQEADKTSTTDSTLQKPPIAKSTPDSPVPLKERFYSIFENMFPSRTQGTSPIEWDSFVKAMNQVGFVARHSGGSAVLFEPAKESKWFKLGKIVFHRPHPDSKIAPIILRAMGKRMGKWFGWTRDSFELEGKEKK